MSARSLYDKKDFARRTIHLQGIFYTETTLDNWDVGAWHISTGARVQELIDVRIKDIRFESASVFTLKGKGSKVRCIPLRN